MPLPHSDVVKDKIREAKFFLNRATEAIEDEFRYYLSAHLNALYTLDEIVRSDFKDFSDWTDREVDGQLHKILLDNRHSLTHLGKPTEEESPRPHLWSETVSDMDSRDSDFKPRRNGGEDFTKEYYFKHEGHFTELAPELAVHYGIGMNVSEICGVHLNRVSQWVDAWLSQQ